MTMKNTPIDLLIMADIKPVGFIVRRHKNGVLVKDGGKIISEAALISEDVIGRDLYTESQMREAIERAVILTLPPKAK